MARLPEDVKQVALWLAKGYDRRLKKYQNERGSRANERHRRRERERLEAVEQALVAVGADIIVDGATEAVECCLSGRLIIDTAGKLAEAAEHTRVLCVARGERTPVYVSRHEVARLNISLLLNRTAMFLDGRKPKLL